MDKCTMCDKETEELCGDVVCRECHVSLSFEDCCDGTWSASMAKKNGYPDEMLKKLYPNAKL